MNLIDLGGKKMADESQATVKEEVVVEPKKRVMDYALETLEINRIVGIGMVLLAGGSLLCSYLGMKQPNASPDVVANAMMSYKEITLLLVGALAGYMTNAKK